MSDPQSLIQRALHQLVHFAILIPDQQSYYSNLNPTYYSLMTLQSSKKIKEKLIKLKSIHDGSAGCIGLLVHLRSQLGQKHALDSGQLLTMLGLLQNMLAYLEELPASDPSLSFTSSILWEQEEPRTNQASDVDKMMREITRILDVELPKTFSEIKSQCFRPSPLVRLWIPVVGSTLFVGLAARHISLRWKDLAFVAQEAYKTCLELVQTWILGPVKQMYETIRYKESRLRVMGAESLSSDLESLERMVVSFAKDTGQIQDSAQLAQIAQKTIEGDLTIVLESYEDELRTPFKSLLTGHLVRPLLIQIQKAKVDAALALSALDRLLRSNELNFAFLALLPLLGVLGFGVSWSKRKWKHVMGLNQRSAFDMMRLGLRYDFEESLTHREIQRLLNHSRHASRLPLQSQGLILIEITHLERLSQSFLSRKHLARFKQDLEELECLFGDDWSAEQGLETCHRMARTWRFLSEPLKDS